MDPDMIATCGDAYLLILDASDCLAFSAVASVRSLVPSSRVLIISSGRGDHVLHRASLVGATLVIHEAAPLDVVSAAVSAITGGGVYATVGAAGPIISRLFSRLDSQPQLRRCDHKRCISRPPSSDPSRLLWSPHLLEGVALAMPFLYELSS